MLEESKGEPAQRFMYVVCRWGEKALEIWKKECRQRCEKRGKDEEAYSKYLAWQSTDKEIALFTSYAYADFKVPKSFDYVFDLTKPDRYVKTKIQLTQSIWEAWFPLGYIDHGHKHLGVFRFEEGIPSIILELYEENEKFSSIPKDALVLGICQSEDFEAIQKARNKVLSS